MNLVEDDEGAREHVGREQCAEQQVTLANVEVPSSRQGEKTAGEGRVTGEKDMEQREKVDFPRKVMLLEENDINRRKLIIKRASRALASLRTFMQQSEKIYKENCDAISKRTPIQEAKVTINGLTAKLHLREKTISELSRRVNEEMLSASKGSSSTPDETIARFNSKQKFDDLKLVKSQDEIERLGAVLKEREGEIEKLKSWLLRDHDRLRQDLSEIQQMEIAFKEEIQRLDQKIAVTKSMNADKDKCINDLNRMICDLNVEIGHLKSILTKRELTEQEWKAQAETGEARITELEKELALKVDLEAKIIDSQNKVKELMEILTVTKDEVILWREKHGTVLQDFDGAVELYEKRLCKLQKELTLKENKLQELKDKDKMNTEKYEKLMEKHKTFNPNFDADEQNNSDSGDSYSSDEELKLRRLQKFRGTRLNQSMIGSRNTFTEKNRVLMANQEMTREINILKNAAVKNTNEIKRYRDKSTALEKENLSLQSKLKTTEDELEALRLKSSSDISMKNGEIDELRAENARLELKHRYSLVNKQDRKKGMRKVAILWESRYTQTDEIYSDSCQTASLEKEVRLSPLEEKEIQTDVVTTAECATQLDGPENDMDLSYNLLRNLRCLCRKHVSLSDLLLHIAETKKNIQRHSHWAPPVPSVAKKKCDQMYKDENIALKMIFKKVMGYLEDCMRLRRKELHENSDYRNSECDILGLLIQTILYFLNNHCENFMKDNIGSSCLDESAIEAQYDLLRSLLTKTKGDTLDEEERDYDASLFITQPEKRFSRGVLAIAKTKNKYTVRSNAQAEIDTFAVHRDAARDHLHDETLGMDIRSGDSDEKLHIRNVIDNLVKEGEKKPKQHKKVLKKAIASIDVSNEGKEAADKAKSNLESVAGDRFVVENSQFNKSDGIDFDWNQDYYDSFVNFAPNPPSSPAPPKHIANFGRNLISASGFVAGAVSSYQEMLPDLNRHENDKEFIPYGQRPIMPNFKSEVVRKTSPNSRVRPLSSGPFDYEVVHNQVKIEKLDGSRTGSAPGQHPAGSKKGSNIKTGRSGMKSPRSVSPNQYRSTNIEELEQYVLTVSPMHTRTKFEGRVANLKVEDDKPSLSDADVTLPSVEEWIDDYKSSMYTRDYFRIRGPPHSPFDDESEGDLSYTAEIPVNGKRASVIKEGGTKESVTGAILYM